MTRIDIARRFAACAMLALAAQLACAEEAPAPPATPAPSSNETAPPGKALLAAKCFQCHNDAMFRDQRQDRRAWEATLYRMVGRGALWTKDEIRTMADYLATDFGPKGSR